jgi:hypothetical protein
MPRKLVSDRPSGPRPSRIHAAIHESARVARDTSVLCSLCACLGALPCTTTFSLLKWRHSQKTRVYRHARLGEKALYMKDFSDDVLKEIMRFLQSEHHLRYMTVLCARVCAWFSLLVSLQQHTHLEKLLMTMILPQHGTCGTQTGTCHCIRNTTPWTLMVGTR